MFRHLRIVLFAFVISASLFVFSQSAFASSSLIISDDSSLGRVTVENDVYKASWQYTARADESFNQSGGNLYGLYFKATDPSMMNNLVAVANYGNGNSVVWAGVGGSGQTRLYISDSQPSPTATNSFADLIGDNNLSGILLDHSVNEARDGSVHLSFTFDLKNQATGEVWLRVAKNWIAYPDGRLDLSITRTFMRGGYVSEPATCFTWNKNGGWTRFEKYGYNWGQDQSPKMISIDGIDQINNMTWDKLNMFYPLWVRLAGSAIAPDITVAAVGGLQSSGLYNLGQTVWNGQPGATMEQSVFGIPLVTAYSMAWMGWWGGNPPQGNRYRFVPAEASETDNYQITLAEPPQVLQNMPIVSNIKLSQINANDAEVSWTTNIPCSSLVTFSSNGNNSINTAVSSGFTTQHIMKMSNLLASKTYNYTVGDSNTEAVLGSGEFNTLAQASFVSLSVSLDKAFWSSYLSYLNRTLTVNYLLTNNGAKDAETTEIVGDRSTAGVTGLTLPLLTGSLSAGKTKVFSVNYLVPPQVMAFNSFLSGKATDIDGKQYSFPN